MDILLIKGERYEIKKIARFWVNDGEVEVTLLLEPYNGETDRRELR